MKKINILEDFELAVRDSKKYSSTFNSSAWPTTQKIREKILQIDFSKDLDLPSDPVNSHYSMRPKEDPVYEMYFFALKQFIESNGDMLDCIVQEGTFYEKAVKTLHNMCKVIDTEGVTNIQSFSTENAIDNSGVLVTWDHVISMWTTVRMLSALSKDARKEFLEEKKVVLDLGSGLGRMCYILKKMNPKITFICCDLPESLILSQYHLPKVFPEEKIYSYSDNREIEVFDRQLLEAEPSIRFIAPYQLLKFQPWSIDIFMNIHSFAEMSQSDISIYQNIVRRTSRFFYNMNRRFFDYKHGTGYFREIFKKDDVKDTFRGEESTRLDDGDFVVKQYPPWPDKSCNVFQGLSYPPWDEWFFEEFLILLSDGEYVDALLEDPIGVFPR